MHDRTRAAREEVQTSCFFSTETHSACALGMGQKGGGKRPADGEQERLQEAEYERRRGEEEEEEEQEQEEHGRERRDAGGKQAGRRTKARQDGGGE